MNRTKLIEFSIFIDENLTEVLEKPTEIRVAFAEDHNVVRQGYISLMASHARIRVVGEADNGKELLDLLKKTPVDVVVMDIEMPLMNGDEALMIMRNRFPDVKVIMLSMHGGSAFITDFISRGASSYLTKGVDIAILERAICSVQDTGHYFNEECSLAMQQEIVNKSSFSAFSKSSLTERENEILVLLCEDMTNKQIGDRLKIEPRTVDFHRQNIYKKTNCKKPAGLAIYAMKNGLISVRT